MENKKEAEEMNINNMIENPNVTYVPSGILGNSALTTGVMYALFIIIGSVLMQVPIAVVSGIAAALIALGGGTTLQMIFCYVGLAVCFFYMGYLFPLFIRPCTKLMHCRNPKFENVAIIAIVLLTIGIRIAFAHVMFEYMRDWQSVDMEIDWATWLEWGFMLIIFLVSSLVLVDPMPPYCEKCGKYMKKDIFKTSSSDSIMFESLCILHKLCTANDGVHFDESEKINYANNVGDNFLAINLEACPVCNDGFITAVHHKKEIGEDKKKRKVQIVAYANILNDKQTVTFRNLLVLNHRV